MRFFHVTSVRNRESIDTHGFDWTLMSGAPGIAGSKIPEAEGCFLCDEDSDAHWFATAINSFPMAAGTTTTRRGFHVLSCRSSRHSIAPTWSTKGLSPGQGASYLLVIAAKSAAAVAFSSNNAPTCSFVPRRGSIVGMR